MIAAKNNSNIGLQVKEKKLTFINFQYEYC